MLALKHDDAVHAAVAVVRTSSVSFTRDDLQRPPRIPKPKQETVGVADISNRMGVLSVYTVTRKVRPGTHWFEA